jgi:putative colanic acid biosynthesis acetyltransferase WcaF
MDEHSCLSHFVDCYCVDRIHIGRYATVSQYSYLCNASHDYNLPQLPLVTAPIVIGDYAWLMADTFVGPGVTIGEGAVVAARSTVIRDIDAWIVVAGSPARRVGSRDRGTFENDVPPSISGDV